MDNFSSGFAGQFVEQVGGPCVVCVLGGGGGIFVNICSLRPCSKNVSYKNESQVETKTFHATSQTYRHVFVWWTVLLNGRFSYQSLYRYFGT